MLKYIEINNFRGIEALKIKNIKKINLIVGKNNCGKTSILEAIFLLRGISNPQLAVNIHGFRDLKLSEDFFYFYHTFENFDFSRSPSITGKLGNQEIEIKLKKRLRLPATNTEPQLEAQDLSVIINVLKEIEPNLIDIRMEATRMVYADVGMNKLIPLNLLGNGIKKILDILSAIFEKQNGILLIDEIENGLHYSSLSVLWKAIINRVLNSNLQLFITTHSYECIEAMTEIYKELNLKEDLISLFRIDKDSGGKHNAFQYEAETLLEGIEKKFELR